ncbi:pilus assembly protein [Ramlibacter tataouinensis]|uniref:Type 4 fimbrial biogenesis protein PilY1-like protein n=1 Tax=Ramlibacter tataouinensis (strain ATCC BAA-407 / DSM 14655 / LMG 21543 / TTB310) TaxID=365046 RepID=F5Y4W3_RAMTT|nr:PilC/PilY family type IV pilus protein [Ramlibacter tataouinensis]AEG92619.1 type 4 fimbrial biogenesis protein PilY1-like protein [Ramlibacter tataouinensis TTB310]
MKPANFCKVSPRPRAWLIGALILLGASGSHAEDIDLFLKNPMAAATRPNLLLIVDNAASNNSSITPLPNGSGNKKLDLIRDVINILTNPLTSPYFPSCSVPADPEAARTPEGCMTREEVNIMVNNINMGLMLMNPSGNTRGGYVRSHIRPMTAGLGNRAKLWDTVKNGIPTANNAPYAKTIHEAYLYFAGKPAYAGFSSSVYDTEAKDGPNYRSPIGDACQPGYIIYIGNGGPDTAEDGDARTLLSGLGGVLSSDPIKFSPSNFQSNWLDEYARTLNRLDLSGFTGEQKLTTYTIAIQNPLDNNFNTAPSTSARALLQSAALAGGGEYALGQDGQSVLKAVLAALRKMQPVNSVFAAVTLPVSVNVRGTSLNQVYMGQFRPDADARPYWPGNLKQYQLDLDANNNPILVDRNKAPVEDKTKGFLLPTITSFWTKASSYWGFTGTTASDAPDGAIVERGGAAQRMRSDFATSTQRANRKLYTCNGSCVKGASLSTVNFATSNIDLAGPTALNLGVDLVERDPLIEWMRGADNRSDENKNSSSTDARAYIHGDLLHSRPGVVNYNRSPGDRDIMVYYGSNDGVFRALKGGQDATDGYEKWGFVFPEFFKKLKRLRDNDDIIEPGYPKPYFADGAVSVYQNDVNGDGKLVAADGDKVYLHVGMRRGGQLIYAFDVSDPDDPKFMWKIDEDTPGPDGITKVFAKMGQSWSSIRTATIAAYNGPVVMFGGGYDPVAEDPQPATSPNTMGQGIYVVDAATGRFLKHIAPAGMGAIPADLTLVDRDFDGRTDRIYAPDTKGNVWRIDISDANMANWKSYKIATLGGSGADARKLLNKVDVVFGDTFDAVLVGSGDREHPFETSIVDRFYMLQDRFVGLNGGLFCGSTTSPASCTHSDLTDVTSYQEGSLPAGSHGWYLTFRAGEKMVSSPVTVFGTVIFSTNRPTPSTDGSTCGNLGEARMYQISFRNGSAVTDTNKDGVINGDDSSEVLAGGGFPPSAVYSPVLIDGKRQEVVCVGPRCFKPGGAGFDTRRHRTYWFKQQ